MKKNTNNAAANKVNAPATENTNNVSANNAPAPAAAVIDAATIAATAAAWLDTYKSIRGIKETSASLINQHGRDTYNAVLTACKATRGAEIAALHTAVKSVLSYNAVLEREYSAILASNDWGKWRALVAANWDTAAEFVAACYPSVLTDGKPAAAVNFTNGSTIYRAFVALSCDTGAAAVSILSACLDNLKKVHGKAADKGKDGAALTCSKTYKRGQAVAAYNVAYIDKVSKEGRQYRQAKTNGAADIAADKLAAVNVFSAGKDGARLATLREYNADLRA